MHFVSRRMVRWLVVVALSVLISREALAAGAPSEPARAEDRAPDHPIVAGFERLHAGGSDAAKGGRLLLGELGCVACHKAGGDLASQVDLKRAPILDAVGTRVRPEYVRAFLADPHG